MTNTRIVVPLATAILLAACGSQESQEGITSAEENQLDEAAAALDQAQAEYEVAVQSPDPEPAADPDAGQ
jgi:uncharacterized lipoprotein